MFRTRTRAMVGTRTKHARHALSPVKGSTYRSVHVVVQCALTSAAITGVGAMLPMHAHAATTLAVKMAAKRYDVPGGPLSAALDHLADQADILLSVAAPVTAGKTSSGVHGVYDLNAAFRAVLAGTGLQATRRPDGSYSLESGTEPVEQTSLPGIAVHAQGANEVASIVNPATTVGSKTPVAQREIPQSVTVLTHEQIQQQGFTSLDQAMKYVPGVQVLNTTSDRVQYYSRGFPLNNYQLDGLPVYTNPNASGTANTQTPSLAMYDRVEVLTGAAGLLDGLGDAGGVVNLVRKHAPATFTAEGQVQGGSYGNQSVELDVGGPLNKSGTVRGLIVGSYQNQDRSQDTTWQRNKLVYGTVEADITSHTLLRLGGSYSEQAVHDSWDNQPVQLSDGTFYVPSRRRYFGADWNRDTSSNMDLFAELQHKFDNGWLVRGAANYSVYKYAYYTTYLNSGVDPLTYAGSLTGLNSPAYEHNKNFEIFATGPITMFGRTHQLTFGANYMQMTNWEKTYYDQPYPNDFPFNISVDSIFNTNVPTPAWTGSTDNTDATYEYAKQYGFYGSAKIRVTTPLTLILGGRVSWYSDRTVPDAVYNADQYTPQTLGRYNARFTPYVGLVYDINDNYSAYFSYTSIFTPQYGAITSNNLGLKPIVGEQYELGVKGEYFSGRLNASAALFQSTQTNSAIPDPAYPNGNYSVAEGKVRDKGFELKVSGRVLPGWDVFAGYTYNLAQYLSGEQATSATSDPYSSPLYQTTPRSQFTVWSNYRLPGRLSKIQVGAGLVATSTTRSSAGYVQGGYYVADARIGYEFTKKDSIALNVTNLFNRDYYSNALYRGRPRVLLVTLRAGF